MNTKNGSLETTTVLCFDGEIPSVRFSIPKVIENTLRINNDINVVTLDTAHVTPGGIVEYMNIKSSDVVVVMVNDDLITGDIGRGLDRGLRARKQGKTVILVVSEENTIKVLAPYIAQHLCGILVLILPNDREDLPALILKIIERNEDERKCALPG